MEKRVIDVFHTGYLELREPDVHFGRANADFGQGFYVTPDQEFASRWAKLKKGQNPVLNRYKLNLEGLKIHRFDRDADWFRYIFRNRKSYVDEIDADLIMGPIANDTIYDTFGIFTTGLLSDDLALDMLKVGPEYVQIALKTEKAAKQLRWVDAKELAEEEILRNKEILNEEQDRYLTLIAEKME